MINSIGDISLFISFILAGFSLFVFTCSYINKSDILVDVGQRFLLSSFFSPVINSEIIGKTVPKSTVMVITRNKILLITKKFSFDDNVLISATE